MVIVSRIVFKVKTTENLIWVQDNPDNPNIKKLDGFEVRKLIPTLFIPTSQIVSIYSTY